MSIVERFPRIRDRSTPSWITDAADDDSDLVEVARRSLLDAVHELSPQAGYPYQLDLRLVGEATRNGRLPTDAMVIANRFQQEVREALVGSELRDIQLDWCGISEGSAVLHLMPRPHAAAENDELDLAGIDHFEAAVAHVLAVHDRLEGDEPDAAFGGERGALLDRVRQMADSLSEQALALEVTAHGSQGKIYSSTLSQRGQRRAHELFSKVLRETKNERVTGLIVSADIEARAITIRSAKHRGKVEVLDIPQQLIADGELRAGVEADVIVELVTDSDRAGRQRSSRRSWIGYPGEQTALAV